jgi:hypothetical protein
MSAIARRVAVTSLVALLGLGLWSFAGASSAHAGEIVTITGPVPPARVVASEPPAQVTIVSPASIYRVYYRGVSFEPWHWRLTTTNPVRAERSRIHLANMGYQVKVVRTLP